MSDDTNIPTGSEPVEPPVEPAANAPAPEAEPAGEAAAPEPTGPTAAAAWGDVVVKLGELGDAITAWAKAAADTPENHKHVDEVRNGVNDMARQANEAFQNVSSSDFGRQMAEGATQMGTAIGGTAQEFGQAAAPHVASAFAGLADVFGRAAQKVGETAAPPTTPDPDARQAPEPPPAPSAVPMPPAAPKPGAADEAAADEDDQPS